MFGNQDSTVAGDVAGDEVMSRQALQHFVSPDDVLFASNLGSRDRALRFIADKAVELGVATDADELFEAFIRREGDGATGMLEGFAIPHAKSPSVSTASVLVLKDEQGVSGWGTMDGLPVLIAIALLIPEKPVDNAHLMVLSKVAEALMDDRFRADLLSADGAAQLAGIINARLL